MTEPGLPSPVSPYPRQTFEFFCPFDMQVRKAQSFPLLSSLLMHYGGAIQALYAKIGCDPAPGYNTIEEVIKALLASGGVAPHASTHAQGATDPLEVGDEGLVIARRVFD